MPPQSNQPRGNPIQDYVQVNERIEKFYEKYPDGRIITEIVEHDAERGFILMKSLIFRNHEEQNPWATGHAYELKSEGYVQRTSYIEVCETSSVGRALAMAGFEVKRGIASREEIEKAKRHQEELDNKSTPIAKNTTNKYPAYYEGLIGSQQPSFKYKKGDTTFKFTESKPENPLLRHGEILTQISAMDEDVKAGKAKCFITIDEKTQQLIKIEPRGVNE